MFFHVAPLPRTAELKLKDGVLNCMVFRDKAGGMRISFSTSAKTLVGRKANFIIGDGMTKAVIATDSVVLERNNDGTGSATRVIIDVPEHFTVNFGIVGG